MIGGAPAGEVVHPGGEAAVIAIRVAVFEHPLEHRLRDVLGGRAVAGQLGEEAEERAVVALTPIAGEDIAKLVGRMLAYGPEDRPSAQVVENEARALLASRSEGDLAAWCSHAVPALDRAAATDDGAVRGRVLAESDVSGRAIVNSATMVLPADEPPPPNPTSRTNDTMALAQPEPPANVGGPLKMAWIVGGLTAAGLLAGV